MDYTHSVGPNSLGIYHKSGDEYNVGYDSLSNCDVDGDYLSSNAGKLALGNTFSAKTKSVDDSEVTAPPTPRSTDSEETTRQNQQPNQSTQRLMTKQQSRL